MFENYFFVTKKSLRLWMRRKSRSWTLLLYIWKKTNGRYLQIQLVNWVLVFLLILGGINDITSHTKTAKPKKVNEMNCQKPSSMHSLSVLTYKLTSNNCASKRLPSRRYLTFNRLVFAGWTLANIYANVIKN